MLPEFATPYLFTYQEGQKAKNLNTRLKDLHLYSLTVDIEECGKVVNRQFAQDTKLPGVILKRQNTLYGMISRRRFLERLSKPYGLELFLERPVLDMYRFVEKEILVLPEDTVVIDAVRKALWRSAELLDEPIVVEGQHQKYALIDVRQLLQVQAEIHQATAELITHLYKDLEKAHHEMQRLATTDELTQVANRRSFVASLDNEWRRMSRELQPISLIIIDIDFFKQYNDFYGHQQGDICLKQVAEMMKSTVQRPADLVARYGGEEFMILLPNTPLDGAIHVANNIHANIRDLNILHERSQVADHVTLSSGIATIVPCPASNPEQIISFADSALYQAKSKGRDRFCIASP